MESLSGLVDLYGVHARREDLRARAGHPLFAGWWERFLAQCREQAEEPVWPECGPTPDERHARAQAAAGRAEHLALAAALTGDERLGRHAAALLVALAADLDPWMAPVHHIHYPELSADLSTAERCKSVAAACSWARPWLDLDERRQVLAALRERGGEVIFADAERGAWWGDAPNSNWCAVLNSGLGLAALAVAEEDLVVAHAWLERACGATGRMLDLAAEEGAGVEGLSYWVYCFRSALDLAQALDYAGDPRLMEHPFWRGAVEFPLHLALPDLSGWASFGDCGYPGLGGSSLLYAIAARTGDGRAQWLANRIVGEQPEERLTYRDLLCCSPDLPEVPPDGTSACRLFSSVQLATLRSGWDRDAVFFLLKGGSNAWSHCHLDLNSFQLSAFGERLAIDPGSGAYTKDYWTSVEPPVSTAWHNTLVADGGDQRQPPRYRMSLDLAEGGDAYCRLGDFLDCEWAALVRGDAATAYADTLERFRRHVVYLKPDTFLLFDDVRVRDARTQRHLQWLLHSEWPMEERDGGLLVQGERAALHVQPLLPSENASKLLPDRIPPGKPGARPICCWSLRPHWHHLWNVSPARSPYPHWDLRGGPRLFGPDYPFLVLLQVTRAGAAPRWQAEPVEQGSLRGARLWSDDTEVLALFNPEGVACTIGDVQTDAEQLVLRLRRGRPDGWLAVRARHLAYGGQVLPAQETPASLAEGDVRDMWYNG